jgi:hypothetical protein
VGPQLRDGGQDVYNAANEEIIREHGRCGGFPVDAVARVEAVINPTTPDA